MPPFVTLPDLALRTLGGSVVAASDESFAEKESLIRPGRPGFQAETFGSKGQVYDGWETRRRRSPGHDWALVRLGIPGVIRGVVIDTAWFKGNYPPYASVEAAAVEGHPSPAELAAASWVEIVPRAELKGDAEHRFAVTDSRRFTHVRLNIFPDGGVARLRVHGEARPDLSVYEGLGLDLAALANGGLVTACSNEFYSSPNNVLAPGLARHQAEGWETARRRDGGNDWLVIRLAGPGVIRLAEIDTTNLLFNAPGAVSLTGLVDGEREVALLPRTPLQPDTPHRFRLQHEDPLTHVRVDIHPDGGLARVRLHGHLATPGPAV
ncbi:allantoicase [Nonomuraea sp. NPDC049695]|uniref:allantoicase n=1 Tax=Nonomuraea sp. NPDC049695 TaxID=3154734 RepID=UPI003444305B